MGKGYSAFWSNLGFFYNSNHDTELVFKYSAVIPVDRIYHKQFVNEVNTQSRMVIISWLYRAFVFKILSVTVNLLKRVFDANNNDGE